jgi:hypothetical protein
VSSNLEIGNWLESLTYEGYVAPINDSSKMEILHRIFRRYGHIGADRLKEILLDAKSRAARALVAVRNDMNPRTQNMAEIAVGLDSGFPHLMYADGWRHGDDLVFDFDDVGTLTKVADIVQEFLMEREHHVWPLCVIHHVGLHPQIRDSHAVWYCKTGSHAFGISRLLTN